MTEISWLCLNLFLGICLIGLSGSTQSMGAIATEMEIISAKIPIIGHKVLDNKLGQTGSGNMNDYSLNNTSLTANTPKKRSKRFLYFNINSALDFGFLLSIPITIVLPPLSNLFNRWKYSKRSLRSLNDDEEASYEDSPVVQPYLDRVNSYFELIKIPEPSCQQRAICEFSSDPDKYFPLSSLVLNQVRDPALVSYFYEKLENGNVTQSLFKEFNSAAEKGLAYGHTACEKSYLTKCPYQLDTRLNLPILKFWQGLQSILNIEFQKDV